MYFLKKLLKYLLFLIKEVHEQTAAFDYYKYGLPFTWSRDDTFKKSDMLWSYLLLALLFDFFTVVFKTYQTFWQHF